MRRQSIKERRQLEDKILIIAGLVFLVIFCVSGFLILNYFLETRKQEKLNAQLAELKPGVLAEGFIYVEAYPLEFEDDRQNGGQGIAASDVEAGADKSEKDNKGNAENTKEESQASADLTEINPDYVFWLEIPDTEIDYPVVQKDNEYYLKRDFFGKKNKHGTIFLDERCSVTEDFLLLHGHNMKDGTMFGSLRNFKKKDFINEHGELIVCFEEKDVHLEIVSAALVDLYDENRFVYEQLPTNAEEAKVYFENLWKHALWCNEIIWEPGQRVVLLSTCDYGSKEERFVVVAIEKK